MEHSKSPFEFLVTDTGIREIASSDKKIIARLSSLEDGIDNDARNKEADGNGVLLTAAPDLLEACKSILPGLKNPDNTFRYGLLEDVEAAIEKATRTIDYSTYPEKITPTTCQTTPCDGSCDPDGTCPAEDD